MNLDATLTRIIWRAKARLCFSVGGYSFEVGQRLTKRARPRPKTRLQSANRTVLVRACRWSSRQLGEEGESNRERNAVKIFGARGGNRTRTVLPPRDFKSLASTSSATRAPRLLGGILQAGSGQGKAFWLAARDGAPSQGSTMQSAAVRRSAQRDGATWSRS